MINKRFSIAEAYVVGFKNTVNHFLFFLVATLIGSFACLGFLVAFGLIDYLAFKDHFDALVKMFHSAMSEATGAVHVAGTTMQDRIGEYLPAPLVKHLDAISINLSDKDVKDVAVTILPIAFAFKLILEVISIGWIKVALDLETKKPVSYDYVYKYYYLAPRVLVVDLLAGIATLFGLVLFVLPGIFIRERLRFARYFVIDKDQSVVQALRSSWDMTDKSVLHLVGYSIVSYMISALATGSFLLLSMFTAPLFYQVDTNVYLQMQKNS